MEEINRLPAIEAARREMLLRVASDPTNSQRIRDDAVWRSILTPDQRTEYLQVGTGTLPPLPKSELGLSTLQLAMRHIAKLVRAIKVAGMEVHFDPNSDTDELVLRPINPPVVAVQDPKLVDPIFNAIEKNGG